MDLFGHGQTGRQSRGLIASAVVVMAACGGCAGSTGSAANPGPPPVSSTDTQVTQAQTTTVDIPAMSSTSTTTAAATTAAGSSAEAALSDTAGDKVSLSLTLGSPAAASTVQDPAVQACGTELTNGGSTLARSVAIPVKLDASLQSASPVPMTVNLLSAMSEVFSGQAFQVSTGELLSASEQDVMPDTAAGAVPMYWATTYTSSGPQCDQASDGDGSTWANVKWSSLSPGATDSWQSWLVIPEQVTPGSPALDSPQSQANWFLFRPVASIGQGAATVSFTTPQTSIVSCGDGGTNDLYVAVDPQAAIARGCKSGS